MAAVTFLNGGSLAGRTREKPEKSSHNGGNTNRLKILQFCTIIHDCEFTKGFSNNKMHNLLLTPK